MAKWIVAIAFGAADEAMGSRDIASQLRQLDADVLQDVVAMIQRTGPRALRVLNHVEVERVLESIRITPPEGQGEYEIDIHLSVKSPRILSAGTVIAGLA